MNPSTARARVLVDELVRCGVREAVLSPGSRSAPVAYALQDAERAGRIRLHVRVDERSAGFLALGLAKLTRVPAVVVTTSGTAVANLLPAVLEAAHADVPLVVLSADRPPELRGVGANQTTRQPGLLGDNVRWGADLGLADDLTSGAVTRTAVDRAVAAARGLPGGQPGPVHLNVPFRDPLTPEEPWGSDPEDPGVLTGLLAGRDRGRPWVEVDRVPSGGAVVPAQRVVDVERTLVVLGDLPEPHDAERAVAWAVGRGYPVVAEPFGGHDRSMVVPSGALLLTADDWVGGHLPDRVVVAGRTTLTRDVGRLLRQVPRVEVLSPDPDWADPWHLAAAVHDLRAALAEAGATPSQKRDRGPEARFRGEWMRAGLKVREAVAAQGLPWPTAAAVAQTVAGCLPPGAVLFAGSSNAARDLDLVGDEIAPGARVVASRGLAGIDGCVSTAAGLALAARTPVWALLGDLTLLHDTNGLLIGPGEPRPDLTIVVPNDDGGGIFTTLEHGEPERAADFERIFGTPTGTDLGALCAAHGVTHRRITDRAELAAALMEDASGIRVLEVPVDRSSHRELRARLRENAAQALRR